MATSAAMLVQGVTRVRDLVEDARERPHSRSLVKWLPVVCVASLTLLAFALRVRGLHASLTGDELYAYDDVHARSLRSMLQYVGGNQESSPPLFFVIAWVSAHLGDPTVAIRWPSIVLGTATVPLVFAFGRRLAGSAAGVLAATLVAVNPFLVWQGSEARPYATLIFCSTLSALLLLVALDSGPRSRWWAAYAVSVAAVVYTHYTAIFVLGGQTLWALWARRERWRELVAATAGAAVLFIPWLRYYHGSGLQAYNTFGVPLVPDKIAATLLRPVIGHPEIPSYTAFPGTVPTVAFLAVLVVGALGLARRPSRQRFTDFARSGSGLVILLALAAPLGVVIYASISYDILLPRNLASSVAFALLAIAVLAAAVWRRWRPFGGVVAAVAIGTMAIGAGKMLGQDDDRANWRQAFAFINAHERPRDSIIDGSLFPLASSYVRWVPVYLSYPNSVIAVGTAREQAGWASARAGARMFVIVSRIGWLSHYEPSPFDGADPRCATANARQATPQGCVALRTSKTFPGLQPLVVSLYSGR